MRRHFLGIGSNVDPKRNVPRILEAVLETGDRLFMSRVVRTSPVGAIEGGDFLNLAVALDSERPVGDLEEAWRGIEVRLGRDREHPDRKRLRREADIDLLFHLPPDARRVESSQLTEEPFLRPVLLELLDYLEIAHGAAPLPLTAGVPLPVAGRWVGKEPAALDPLTENRR